jgi:hypothetical protein
MSDAFDDDLHDRVDTPTVREVDEVGATWRILERPGYLRSLERFLADDPPVSTVSTFRQEEWIWDLPPPNGYPTSRIGFHDIAEPLAGELKLAVLIAVAHPSSRRLKLATAASFGHYLAMLGRWMTHAGLTTINDLGAGFGTLFLEALAEFVSELHGGTLDVEAGDWDPRARNAGGAKLAILGAGGKMTKAGVEALASALIYLEEASALLERFVGARVRGKPFDTDVAAKVAAAFPEAADRTTRRLPDAVLKRLLPAARRMLGVPAEDVGRLVDRYIGLCGNGLPPSVAARQLAEFEFGEVAEGEGPWSPSILAVDAQPARAIRALLQQVLAAAILLILLGTGLRPGELLGLLGGRRPRDNALGRGDDWLPLCVTESLSKSGFSVAMLLHGHVFKKRKRPWPVSWLLALRQADEGDPWVLKALRTIEELSEKLRPLAGEDAREILLLDFAGRGYDELIVDRVHSGKLAGMVRRSIPRFADLSGIGVDGKEAGRPLRPYVESNGACVALYQCRKTYAQTLYAISPILLIPISRQYQHGSPDATFNSYVTKDPIYSRELETYRARRNARLVHQALEGGAIEGETMGPAIDRMLAAAAPRPPVRTRVEFWDRCQNVADGLFQPGRLRPTAGAANLFGPDAAVVPAIGADAEIGRVGPAILRMWSSARREVEAADANGEPQRARAARDNAIGAGRSLAGLGLDISTDGHAEIGDGA